MMKRFITYLVFLILGSFLLLNAISAGSLYFLRKASFYKPSYLVNQVEKENFDYIVLGASTGLTTLNTKIIDSLSGLSGINLSMDDTGISSHYLMLHHFLAEGKTTDYCILTPGLGSYDDTKNIIGDNDYRFLMYVNRAYVADYYKTLKTKGTINVSYLSKWMPFLGVSYYNAELFFSSLLCAVKSKKRNRFDDYGNYSYPFAGTKLVPCSKSMKDITFKNPYIKKIKNLCKENGIKLIYYFPPNRIISPNILDTSINFINHSDRLKSDSYFYDDIHVNTQGSKKASRMFCRDFLEYYFPIPEKKSPYDK